MTPNPPGVALRATIQIMGVLILMFIVGYIHFYPRPQPYKRGFYCDDENLKHPYIENESVPSNACLAMWTIILFVIIIPVEILREMSRGAKDKLDVCGLPVPWLVVELYRHVGFGIIGCLTMLIFTDISKLTIGRLRPHFLTLCRPDYDQTSCQVDGYNKFVTEDVCTGVDKPLNENSTTVITEKMITEARMSFMSGHASWSFFFAVFLVIFLQARLNKFPKTPTGHVETIRSVLKISRPFVQFTLLIFAFWISLTRISDYYHHPLDVITGALVGITFAFITHAISNMFQNRTAFWRFFQQSNSVNESKNFVEDP